MKTMKMNEDMVQVFQTMEACASELSFLIFEESVFEGLLTGKDPRGDLLDAFFFNCSFDEEMMDWSSFFMELLGDDFKKVEKDESQTPDERIDACFEQMTAAVARLNSMDIDREKLVSLYPEKNPFALYGFEKLEEELTSFRQTYKSLA